MMEVAAPLKRTASSVEQEPDDYLRYKDLERQLEFLEIQEEYIKVSRDAAPRATGGHGVGRRRSCAPAVTLFQTSAFVDFFLVVTSLGTPLIRLLVRLQDEQKNLKRELKRAQEEVKRIKSVPLVIGQFLEMVEENMAIVSSTTGSHYYVRVLSTLNREDLKANCSVALHRHANSVVDILPPEADSTIQVSPRHVSCMPHCPERSVDLDQHNSQFSISLNCRFQLLGEHERPTETFADIGGACTCLCCFRRST